jgi:hypothetical protein
MNFAEGNMENEYFFERKHGLIKNLPHDNCVRQAVS